MDKRSTIKIAGMAVLTALVALPAAFILTVATFPFWRWFEKYSGVESYGHSGPAQWCYWMTYAVLLILTATVFWRVLVKPGLQKNK